MRRKVATALVAGALAASGLTVAAAPAQACVGVQCTIDCIRQIVSGSRVCPD